MSGVVDTFASNAGRARLPRARFGVVSRVALLAVLAGMAAATWAAAPSFTAGARPLITKQFLYNEHHVMQSFAFNAANGEIYAVQVEGADELGTWEQHSANGDLELSRLSADGRAVLGHMCLEGFGHGVSIGVEPADGAVYVWTEVDSRPNSEGSGRGSQLGRFPFVDGQTLRHTDPVIAKYAPIADAVQVTPSVNAAEGLLLERYVSRERQFRLALFRLADVKAGGHPTPLRDIVLPRDLGTFQGYCAEGDRIYLLTGEAYGAKNPPPGNAEIFCVDWITGRILAQARTDIFGDQVHREPEGMAIRTNAHGRRFLCFGFASSISQRDGRRVFSIAAMPLAVLPPGAGPVPPQPASLRP